MAVTASQTAPLRGDKRWGYLDRAKSIRVASVNADGSIYLTPLWFVVDEKRIFLPIDAGSRHGANSQAAGRSPRWSIRATSTPPSAVYASWERWSKPPTRFS